MTEARATSPALEALLSRLERVRPCGRGFRADSPCGNRSPGALSMAVGDNGCVLLKDHSGYAAADVLSALGLTIADLFPERLKPATPEARRELRERALVAEVRAALGVVTREALIVRVAAEQVRRGAALDDVDAARLDQALERIESARVALNAKGVPRG